MGEVYRARDTRLDRLVAIKVLLPERAGREESKARFIQEAKAASALNHPNIVTIYDIGADQGVDYIAMEFVPARRSTSSSDATGCALPNCCATPCRPPTPWPKRMPPASSTAISSPATSWSPATDW